MIGGLRGEGKGKEDFVLGMAWWNKIRLIRQIRTVSTILSFSW
jgi:hypothetical protein